MDSSEIFLWRQTSLTLWLVFCKEYISLISIHSLPRLCTSNIDRSNEKNGFTLKKARRRYPAETIMGTVCADDIALLTNISTQAKSLPHRLEQVAGGIDFYVNVDKMVYMCFNQEGDFSTVNSCSLKSVDKFMYLSSSVSSTESGINMSLAKAWMAINRLAITWKSELSNKIKRNFFSVVIVSILLYGCTTWTLTKRIEKKLKRNCTRMLRAILNKS